MFPRLFTSWIQAAPFPGQKDFQIIIPCRMFLTIFHARPKTESKGRFPFVKH